MRLHRNAKTTPHMRALLVHRIGQEGWETSEAADAAGISVRTAYKWLARYRTGGAPALDDAPSTPHRQPRRTPDTVIAEIVAARQQRLTGWAIAVRLRQARSTVARILCRVGLNRLPPVEPPSPVHRYERTRPGELVHLDIKPLARILRPGHRIHGDRRQTVEGAADVRTAAPRAPAAAPDARKSHSQGSSRTRTEFEGSLEVRECRAPIAAVREVPAVEADELER